MGLLDPGGLSKAIFKGFKGKLKKGRIRRETPTESAGLDDKGDPISVGVSFFAFEGFDDGYDAAYRQRAGIPEGDNKVNAFAASLPPGFIPAKDDKAEIPTGSGSWYQVRKVTSDPATAMWVLQSFVCKAPED